MKSRLLLLVLTLLLGPCSPCPDCKATSGEPAAAPTVKKWWRHRGEINRHFLYYGPALVGRYDHVSREYRPWEAGRWGAPAACPVELPPVPADVIKKGENFGIDLDKLNWEGYSVNGVPASREQVFAVMDADIPDDDTKARITVMGPDVARNEVMRGLRGWLDKNGLPTRVILWSGAENDPILERRGFACSPGKLTVYIQEPKGKQLGKYVGTDLAAIQATCETALNKWDSKLFPGGGGGGGGLPVSEMAVVAGILGLVCIVQAFRRPRLV